MINSGNWEGSKEKLFEQRMDAQGKQVVSAGATSSVRQNL